MSLVITFATAHGIVMAADRCITTTLVSGKSFVLTDQERKLFLADCGYAFSYTGSSSFDGKPIEPSAAQWEKVLLSLFSGAVIVTLSPKP